MLKSNERPQGSLFEALATLLIKVVSGALLGGFALLIYFANAHDFGAETALWFILAGIAFALVAWPLFMAALALLLRLAYWTR